ncbi:MAG: hypothetical protein V1862_12665 [Methanobacteriota archaeon]
MKKITKIVQILIMVGYITGMGASVSAGMTSLPAAGWSIPLDGDTKGALNQAGYEEGTNFQRSSEKFVSLVDGEGKVWDGMPLWQFAEKAENNAKGGVSTDEAMDLNDTLTHKGYQITVTGNDGKETTLASTDIAQNNNYILADTLNGNPLAKTDSTYPLVLVGKNLPTDQYIGGISKITLHLNE